MDESLSQEKPKKPIKTKPYWFKKIVLGLLLFLAALILAFFLLFAWLSSSQKGLELVVNWLNDSVAGVSIQKAEGRLIGPIFLEGLRYKTESMDYAQKTLRVDWSPSSLLKRQIVVDSLSIDGIELSIANSSENTTNDSPVEIPDSIELPFGLTAELREVVLSNLLINTANNNANNKNNITDINSDLNNSIITNGRYPIDKISLAANTTQNSYQLEKLSIVADWVELSLDAVVGNQKPFTINSEAKLKLSLEKVLGEQFAEINTSLLVEGNTDSLNLKQTINAPYNLSLDVIAESLLDDLFLNLSANFDQTELDNINSVFPSYSISTDLQFNGSPSIFTLNGQGDIAIDKNIQLAYTLQSKNISTLFDIEKLTVTPRPNSHNSQLELLGSVDLSSEELVLDLESRWNNLAWPLETQKPTQSDELDFYSPNGTLTIVGSVKQLLLEMDAIVGDNGAVSAVINGNNIDQSQRSINALINWENLQYPLLLSNNVLPSYKSQKGAFTLIGNEENYNIKLSSDISTSALSSAKTEFIDGSINLLGSGTQTTFDLESLLITPSKINGETSQLMAIGNAQFAKDFSTVNAELDIAGEDVNPALLVSDWPGNLDIDLQLEAKKVGDNISAAINKLGVDGQLREYPIELEAKALLNNAILDIQTLSLNSGGSLLEVDGQFSKELLNGRWNLVSQDLTNVYPGAKGAVIADGNINGSLRAPIAKATIKANDVTIDTVSVDKLDALLDVDLSSQNSQNNIDISVKDLLLNNLAIDTVNAELIGSLNAHTLQLSADSAQGQFENTIGGSYSSNDSNAQWQFFLEKLTLAPSQFNAWQLQNKTKGKVSLQGAQIEPLCIVSENNALCIDANASFADNATNTIDANLDISQLDYQYFSPLLSDTIEINNAGISGNAKLSLFNNSLKTLDVAFTTQKGTIQIPFIEPLEQEDTEQENLLSTLISSDNDEGAEQATQWVSFLLAQGNIDIRLENNQLDLNSNLPFDWYLGHKEAPKKSKASSEGNAKTDQGLSFSLQTNGLDSAPLNEQALTGELKLNAYDLDPIIALIPQLAVVPSEQEKAFRANINIGGNFNEPKVEGFIALDNLELTVIDAGITLSDIQSEISSNNTDLEFKAQLSSKPAKLSVPKDSTLAPGQLAIKGVAQLEEKLLLTMDIEGNQFQALNTTEAKAVISPLITITADPDRVDVNGELIIPSALFAPNKIQSSAVSASADQIIVSDDPEEFSGLPDLFADIRVQLGDDVKVESFGFKGDIKGAIDAVVRPNSPTTGLGELNILNGEYRAYGQGLVIERGQILFTGGNIEQPGVDIKAQRNPAENLIVGIIAQGDIREPDFTLFSEPAMTQTEQLSWLILGKSFSESSSGEGNALSQLALSFGLSTGDDFLQNFNGQLGIDSIAIETGSGEAGAFSDNEQAALTLGKYLTPKLYLSYGIGLFEALDTIKLEYLINDSFKIATESSSAASGVDIIYNIGSD